MLSSHRRRQKQLCQSHTAKTTSLPAVLVDKPTIILTLRDGVEIPIAESLKLLALKDFVRYLYNNGMMVRYSTMSFPGGGCVRSRRAAVCDTDTPAGE